MKKITDQALVKRLYDMFFGPDGLGVPCTQENVAHEIGITVGHMSRLLKKCRLGTVTKLNATTRKAISQILDAQKAEK